jgi:hypothetical protein
MKFVLIFLVIIVSLVRETNQNLAEAVIYFSGTNDLLGTIGFNEQEEAWGVIISGALEHLRPNAILVRQLSQLISSMI